jgi:hypothetical protein
MTVDNAVEDLELRAHEMIRMAGISIGLTGLRANCPSRGPAPH